ncbi:MAG TPA: hypothetical protein VFB38_20075 [Chthonomonadaceae bacterium]|nr:hypothetical protein [Chthonomonadaceae bacterium]
MTLPLLELEGTWEEIAAHGPELAGRKVRLIVLPSETESPPEQPPAFRPASGRSLLRHVGTWAGDDLKACLQEVYANRTKTRF